MWGVKFIDGEDGDRRETERHKVSLHIVVCIVTVCARAAIKCQPVACCVSHCEAHVVSQHAESV